MKFQRVILDEETEDYYVDGEHMLSATHDGLGWEGMSECRKLFSRIATKLGVEVEVIEGVDADDFRD